jgi:hypothetical protein
MALFSTLAKSPLFLRTAAGAVGGGVVFHRAAESRERGSGDVSAIAKAGTTLLGMATGAAVGASFPFWKRGIADKYKRIHGSYDGVLKRVMKDAKATTPDFTHRVKAAAETYIKPSVVMPAGMLVGAAVASGRGEDPIAGAMTGGLAAGGLGLGYHGFQVYNKLGKYGGWKHGFAGKVPRAAMGAGMVGSAFALGMSTNQPEYKEEARAVPTYNGYEPETIQMNYQSGAGRRSMEMGATGDLVFGLQNMRHGH